MSDGTAASPNAGAGILDTSGLQRLRGSAHENSPEALKKAASQFEALFLDMVMKSMRDAAPSESLMGSEQGKMVQGMLDQQYAKALAARGMGLADVLARQMTPGISATTAPARDVPHKVSLKCDFIDKLRSHAEQASAATGIPARFMVAQAALESGWGRREIRAADGGQSHNVFGIKAGSGWKGKVTEVATTEYVNGVAQRRVERFRAYDSYAEAFADYAKTLTTQARYREVIASASDALGFARGLQRAGYATDPHYAEKLSRVIARV